MRLFILGNRFASNRAQPSQLKPRFGDLMSKVIGALIIWWIDSMGSFLFRSGG